MNIEEDSKIYKQDDKDSLEDVTNLTEIVDNIL